MRGYASLALKVTSGRRRDCMSLVNSHLLDFKPTASQTLSNCHLFRHAQRIFFESVGQGVFE